MPEQAPARRLVDRLLELAARAFMQHGDDAELYNGIKDCAAALVFVPVPEAWRAAALLKVRTRVAIADRVAAGESAEAVAADYGVPVAFVTTISQPGYDYDMPAVPVPALESHRVTCALWYCGWEWNTGNGYGVCRQPRDSEIHYIGTVDNHTFVEQACNCGAADAYIAHVRASTEKLAARAQAAEVPVPALVPEPEQSLVTDCEETGDERCGECAECRKIMWLDELEKRSQLKAENVALRAERDNLRVLVEAGRQDEELLNRVQDADLTIREALSEREALRAERERVRAALKGLPRYSCVLDDACLEIDFVPVSNGPLVKHDELAAALAKGQPSGDTYRIDAVTTHERTGVQRERHLTGQPKSEL